MAKIRIKRKAHARRAYTRRDGTKVPACEVSATTFEVKDRGTPGRRARGSEAGPYRGQRSWISREGGLGGSGYLGRSNLGRKQQMGSSVKHDGYRTTLGRVMVLERNTELSRTQKRKLARDRRWLVKKYGGEGSFGDG